MKKKYKYKYKSDKKDVRDESIPKRPKTSVSVKLRMLLLLVWSIIAVGIYVALSKRTFFFSMWFFAILLAVAFAAYFVIGLRVSKYIRDGKGESDKCIKLIDMGKMLLIFMIPSVFIIIYDFIATTYKMFM